MLFWVFLVGFIGGIVITRIIQIAIDKIFWHNINKKCHKEEIDTTNIRAKRQRDLEILNLNRREDDDE